ncbi:hypothetical protein RUM43_007904 [Polyplax serrata]|uniref:Uncharacterized protein n=1 Tax=Polyplax serrata TaxID=468196 RepID=A0AAN8SA97_POLSC
MQLTLDSRSWIESFKLSIIHLDLHNHPKLNAVTETEDCSIQFLRKDFLRPKPFTNENPKPETTYIKAEALLHGGSIFLQ